MELRTQAQLETAMMRIWTLVALVSTIAAYIAEDQSIAWFTLLAMALVTALLIVPEWPFWNKNPLEWRGVDLTSKKD